jgi:hypothetical protein
VDRKYDKEEPSKLGALNMTEAISIDPMGGTKRLLEWPKKVLGHAEGTLG